MNIDTIFWDFDGVILDSMAVRDWGFREVFKGFTEEQVESLMKFHRENGGLSRYVKIRYFYEEILEKAITEEKVLEYAKRFSGLMKKELTNSNNLINDSTTFIKNNFKKYNFHVVSGSDQEELRFLCRELNINTYFISIHGSPTPKKKLVANLLNQNNYDKKRTCLIGDSMNDYEAANENKILFFGYNNNNLKGKGLNYISSFKKSIF